jgi:hypothetical protein
MILGDASASTLPHPSLTTPTCFVFRIIRFMSRTFFFEQLED